MPAGLVGRRDNGRPTNTARSRRRRRAIGTKSSSREMRSRQVWRAPCPLGSARDASFDGQRKQVPLQAWASPRRFHRKLQLRQALGVARRNARRQGVPADAQCSGDDRLGRGSEDAPGQRGRQRLPRIRHPQGITEQRLLHQSARPRIEGKPTDDSQIAFEAFDRSSGSKRCTGTRVDLLFGSYAELRAIAEVYASADGEAAFVKTFVKTFASAIGNVMHLDRFALHG